VVPHRSRGREGLQLGARSCTRGDHARTPIWPDLDGCDGAGALKGDPQLSDIRWAGDHRDNLQPRLTLARRPGIHDRADRPRAASVACCRTSPSVALQGPSVDDDEIMPRRGAACSEQDKWQVEDASMAASPASIWPILSDLNRTGLVYAEMDGVEFLVVMLAPGVARHSGAGSDSQGPSPEESKAAETDRRSVCAKLPLS